MATTQAIGIGLGDGVSDAVGGDFVWGTFYKGTLNRIRAARQCCSCCQLICRRRRCRRRRRGGSARYVPTLATPLLSLTHCTRLLTAGYTLCRAGGTCSRASANTNARTGATVRIAGGTFTLRRGASAQRNACLCAASSLTRTRHLRLRRALKAKVECQLILSDRIQFGTYQ